MKRLINSSGRRGIVFGLAALCLLGMLSWGVDPALAQETIPVMVDYFDTGAFGSTSPAGVAFIPTTCNFAIVDNNANEVVIVDSLGIVQSRFDTTAFGSTDPSGISCCECACSVLAPPRRSLSGAGARRTRRTVRSRWIAHGRTETSTPRHWSPGPSRELGWPTTSRSATRWEESQDSLSPAHSPPTASRWAGWIPKARLPFMA